MIAGQDHEQGAGRTGRQRGEELPGTERAQQPIPDQQTGSCQSVHEEAPPLGRRHGRGKPQTGEQRRAEREARSVDPERRPSTDCYVENTCQRCERDLAQHGRGPDTAVRGDEFVLTASAGSALFAAGLKNTAPSDSPNAIA